MRPLKDIQKIVAKFNVKPGPQMRSKVLDEALEIQRNLKPQSASGTYIWRIIMKSNITKFAAAAMIILVLFIGVNQFGGSISLTTISFADISKAMENETWIYAKSSSPEGITLTEMWIGFKSKIRAFKSIDGRVSFTGLNEHRNYTYDPNSHSITIVYNYANDFDWSNSSPIAMIENEYLELINRGVKIITSQAEYEGKQVQLQEAKLLQSNINHLISWYIQPGTKLLLAKRQESISSSGEKRVRETIYDYPQSGPLDIYALGVPRDTKILYALPGAAYIAIWDSYRQKSAEATSEYIAVITHSSQADIIDRIDVDYKSGQNHRWESHSVFTEGQQIEKLWPEYKKQLGDSIESYLAWTVSHYKDSGAISIELYDEPYYCSTSRDDKGQWSDISKLYSPDYSNMHHGTLEIIGWPHIFNTNGYIIEDDYSKQNILICIEFISHNPLLSRSLYYIDPKKDYLCVRRVTETSLNTEWQGDQSWLEDTSYKDGNGSIVVADITETIQAPNGHWYPKTIERKQTGISKDYKEKPLSVTDIKKVYIQTNPKFPDGIFNAEKLPGK